MSLRSQWYNSFDGHSPSGGRIVTSPATGRPNGIKWSATMLEHYCPGSSGLRKDITLTIKTCPECGSDVELFSIDKRIACDTCGFVVYNNLQSCVQWCRYAEQCVGAEMVAQFKKA